MAEVALLVFEEIAHLLDRPGWNLAAGDSLLVHQGEVDVESGHERDVTLEHQVDPFIVDEVAVLDAGDACTQRVLDAGRAFGVSQRAVDAGGAGFLNNGPHLLDGELRRVGGVGGRPDSAGGHDLDPVGAGSNLQPGRAPNRIRSVGYARRQVAHLGPNDRAGRRPPVVMAPRLGERLAADLGTRSRECAGVECPLDPGRCPAGVANSSHAALEKLTPGLEATHHDVCGRALDPIVDRLEA